MFKMFKNGKAHKAAVKSARGPEAIQKEYEEVCGAIGEREYRRQVLQAEVNGLCARAMELNKEAALATEKARRQAEEQAKKLVESAPPNGQEAAS